MHHPLRNVYTLALCSLIFFVSAQGLALAEQNLSPQNLVAGAREEVNRRPLYRSAYYKGGHPPATEGVCTDLVWRAFRFAGFDLKQAIDNDIRSNPKQYPRVQGKPDPNIDFRRVPNMMVYFKKYWRSVSGGPFKEKEANIQHFQAGDIVVFSNPDHIAILSDKRNSLGIPLLLHNDGPWAREADDFMSWHDRGYVGHFRMKTP